MGKQKKELLVRQIQDLQADLQMKPTSEVELMKQSFDYLNELKESLVKAEAKAVG